MPPSLPDMVNDTRSPSHSSLVCIIRPADIAAAAAVAAVATAAVAVAVGSLSPPTLSMAGGLEGWMAGGLVVNRSRSRRRLVSPSPNLRSPCHRPAPYASSNPPQPPNACDYSPAELSHKASAVFRRDAPPPGMQGLHEW